MNTVITFEPEAHKYFDQNGVEYTSVTTFLGQLSIFDSKAIAEKVSKIKSSRYYGMSVERILAFWDASADHGTVVHNAIEDYIKHDIWPSDPSLVPLVEQFSRLRFKGELLSETLVWDEEYLLAGTADILEVTDKYIYVWDIKTSNKLSDDKLTKFSFQLELYKRMVEKRFNKKAIVTGILWFEDYVMKRSKTKLKVVRPLMVEGVVDDILRDRKLAIQK